MQVTYYLLIFWVTIAVRVCKLQTRHLSKPGFSGLETPNPGFGFDFANGQQVGTVPFLTAVKSDGYSLVYSSSPNCFLCASASSAACRLLNTKPTISEHWTPKCRLKTVKISSITCRQNGSLKINLSLFSIISLSLSIIISLMFVDHFIFYVHGKITHLCHSPVWTKIGCCLSLYLFVKNATWKSKF